MSHSQTRTRGCVNLEMHPWSCIISRMIINSGRTSLWLFWGSLPALLGLGVGCDGPESSVPSPYQGVVELDQRTLSFELGGRIATIDVVRGAEVAAGVRLAGLDDSLAGPTRAARVAELAAAKAQLALLEAGARPDELKSLRAQIRSLRANERTVARLLTRQRSLVEVNAAPVASLDELSGKLDSTRAQRQAIQHQLAAVEEGARAAELDLARARIQGLEAALEAEEIRQSKLVLHAPSAGTILEVIADPGEVASPGSPIVTLGDRDHPYVDVFVPIAKLAPLDVGQAAEVIVDGVDPPVAATIERISPTTEFTPRYVFSKQERPHLVVRVRLRVADPEHRLHPGLPAFAIFAAHPPEDPGEGD